MLVGAFCLLSTFGPANASAAPPSSADLAVTITAPATVAPNTNMPYTATITNNGPDPATHVEIIFPMPTGETFANIAPAAGFFCNIPVTVRCDALDPIPSGGSASFDLTVHVDGAVADGTTLTNAPEVTFEDQFDPVSSNNTGSADTQVVAPRADIAVSTTAPATVAPGANMTYTATITNNGPDAATHVEIIFPMPTGETFVTIAPGAGFFCNIPVTVRCDALNPIPTGGSVSFDVTVHVDAAVADGTLLSNSPTLTFEDQIDPVSSNNVATAVTQVVAPRADLEVSVSAPATVAAGTDMTYTTTITNNGPDAATRVEIIFPMPGGETFVTIAPAAGFFCNIPVTVRCDALNPIPSGQSVSFDLTVHVDSAVADGTTLTNAPAVTFEDQLDPVSSNNTASATTTVTAPDTTPPTVTPVVAGTLGSNGWYTSDVSLTWNVVEPESPGSLVEVGCDSRTITSDQPATTYTCTASSRGGAAAPVSVSIKRDATAPALAFSGNAGRYTVAQTVAIGCSASDALSGIAQGCAGVNAPAASFGLGHVSVTRTATDLAGNSGSGTVSFDVTVDPSSLCTLTRQYVQSSNRYQALGASAKRVVDVTVTAACQILTNIGPALRPDRKASFIHQYQNAVQALAAAGWLTSSQAAALSSFAAAL